jgi:hypothetical protein
MNENPKFVFIHVPRTAGTTFKKMLRDLGYKSKGDNAELHNLRMVVNKGAKKIQPFTYTKDIETLRNKKLIQGHTLLAKYYPLLKDTHKFITWLRDPVERTISQYDWWRWRGPRGGDIGGHLRIVASEKRISVVQLSERMRNIFTLMLGNDLSVFDFIGIQEHFDDSLQRFADTFGFEIPEYEDWNVKGKNYKPKKPIKVTEAMRKRMMSHHKKDYKLYNEALNYIYSCPQMWRNYNERNFTKGLW